MIKSKKEVLENANIPSKVKDLFNNEAPVTAWTVPTVLRNLPLNGKQSVTFIGYEVRRKNAFKDHDLPEVMEDLTSQTLIDNIEAYYPANVFEAGGATFRAFPENMPEDPSSELTFMKIQEGKEKDENGVAIPRGASERYDAFAVV